VKPDNMLWDGTSQLFLVDFGLAAQFDDEAMWSRRSGPAPYLSPEMLGPSPVRNRRYSDQFSFGVTLYQLLTGALPFDPIPKDGPDHDQALACTAARIIAGEEPVPCRRRVESLPVEVGAVLERMLRADALERYPSNLAASEDLTEALDGWELRSSGDQSGRPWGAHLYDLSFLDRIPTSLFALNRSPEAEI